MIEPAGDDEAAQPLDPPGPPVRPVVPPGGTISPAPTSPPSPDAVDGGLQRCGSERASHQYASPPKTIEASHERSTPSVARAIGPWKSDALPCSIAYPATNPVSSATSARHRMSP
jgi:hypothetical protein